MKKRILLAFFLVLALNVFSQSDSVAFIHGPWLSERIDGLVLRRCHFKDKSLFASNQQILVWELAPTADFSLRLAYRPERTKTSDMARKQHAVAAVNGSFFDMDRHHPVLFLRVDGVDVGSTSQGEAQLARKDYQYGTLAVDHDHVFILKTDTVPQWEENLPYPNLMTARPLLLFNGASVPLREDLGFVSDRHNRTAVGVRADGTVLLVVVHLLCGLGRQPRRAQLSLRQWLFRP